MKKTIYLIAVLIFCICSLSWAQTQLNKWYISPKEADVSTAIPSVTALPTVLSVAPPVTSNVANGMYDSGGNLVFYIADGSVYDYNNTLIGTVQNSGAEIAIVPFRNNNACQHKYNIFTTIGPGRLIRSVLDMQNYSLTSEVADIILAGNSEFGAIAVSPETPDLVRHLYFMVASGSSSAGGQCDMITINPDGSVSTPTVLIVPYATLPNSFSGIDLLTLELDLSPHGEWLAWSSYESPAMFPFPHKYHILHLNPSSGQIDNTIPSQTFRHFDLPSGLTGNNPTGFRGVEFWQDATNTKLFLGAGTDGIFNFDIPLLSNPQQVFGSNPDFGLSQIELANNTFMYASSPYVGAGIYNVGAFNPASLAPAMLLTGIGSPSFTLGNPGLANPNPPASSYYLLPNSPSTLYTLPD